MDAFAAYLGLVASVSGAFVSHLVAQQTRCQPLQVAEAPKPEREVLPSKWMLASVAVDPAVLARLEDGCSWRNLGQQHLQSSMAGIRLAPHKGDNYPAGCLPSLLQSAAADLDLCQMPRLVEVLD